MGACLSTYALFIDTIDELNQKQMFITGTEEHTQYKAANYSYWYWRNLWTNVTQGGLGCCSDLLISDHYISPKRMNFLEYLVYHVHPFGLKKNLTEKLPRKLTLKEMIKLSEAKTYSPNRINHTIRHNFEESEKFK
jgi:glycoprotein-N-acetylgalactosamine 3-beta-galactosyltransferase